MQKRFRVRWLANLALLVIAGLLITIAILDKPAPPPSVKYLGDYLSEEINEIRILRPGKKDIHFISVNDYWNMLTPYPMRAEDSLIRQILSLSMLEISAFIDDTEIDRSNFGLQSPVVTIQLNQHWLNFGDNLAINNSRYIELDNQIMLVPDLHVTQLKVGSISYIDRHLIPQGTHLNALRIAGNSIDLGKSGDIASKWLNTKASWISLAPGPQTQHGDEIFLELDNEQTIHYIVERRESDVVLLNTQHRLEYHLPIPVAESLELLLPTLDTPQYNKQTGQ